MLYYSSASESRTPDGGSAVRGGRGVSSPSSGPTASESRPDGPIIASRWKVTFAPVTLRRRPALRSHLQSKFRYENFRNP